MNEDTFVAVGYDKAPFVFKRDGDDWTYSKVLDKGFEEFKDYSKDKKRGSVNYFKLREIESDIKISDDIKMKERDTKHENTIQQLVDFPGASGGNEICTADDNGNIFFWKV